MLHSVTGRLSLMLVAFALFPFPTNAEIADPVQRRAWFYLQHLSVEINSIENCIISDAVDAVARNLPSNRPAKAALRRKYVKVADELGREVESYVNAYLHLFPNETKYSYSHDVWRVVARVGAQQAREATASGCMKYVDQP